MKIENCKLKITKQGFTLIELLVAIFIFSMITVAIVSVFVSTVTSYGKAKAIKTVKENAEFAMSSIAKDVRMGKIENYYKVGIGNTIPLDGGLEKYFVVTRNRGGKVCYHIEDTATDKFLGIQEGIGPENSCSDSEGDYSRLVDLSETEMKFDSTAGFYSLPTDTTSATKRRGWVEINLNIAAIGSIGMDTDQINVQTIVSSRDYGWEDVNP